MIVLERFLEIVGSDRGYLDVDLEFLFETVH